MASWRRYWVATKQNHPAQGNRIWSILTERSYTGLSVAGIVRATLPALLMLLASLPMAAAQDSCRTEFTLVGKNDVNWHLPEGGGPNPRLTACPGEDITFHITVEGNLPHNFVVRADGAPPKTVLLEEGEAVDYVWRAPAEGTFAYVCELHAGPMRGTVDAAAAPLPSGSAPAAGGNDAPAPPLALLALATLGAALLARRRGA